MKRRLAAILAAVMLLGVGIAIAVGNTGADPMISKSYWENTYLPTLTEALQKRASQGTKAAYDAAAAKLTSLGEADVKAAGSLAETGYAPVTLKAGDSLELAQGASVILYSGACRLNTGTMADVTAGTQAGAGTQLVQNHRYVVTATAATLAQSQDGSLGYQGTGTLKQGGGNVGGGSGQPGGEAQSPFTDVQPDQWYYGAVSFVYQKGYFSGTGAGIFSPNEPMNRAMVATVLYRVAGSEKVTGATAFEDVADGQWYSQAIAWASAKGVVNGMGDNRYAPDLAVTREQLVTMLYRFEKDYRNKKVSTTGDLGAFPDGSVVSSWARDAMSWAVGEKLIQGRNTGHLDPSGTATRAEVATVLQRFAARLEKS